MKAAEGVRRYVESCSRRMEARGGVLNSWNNDEADRQLTPRDFGNKINVLRTYICR